MSNKSFSVVDYFREKDDPRYKDSRDFNEYLKSLSVKNSYGIQVSNIHRKQEENELKKLMTSDITKCLVKTEKTGNVEISIYASNLIEQISVYERTLKYEDCKKVQEVTDEAKYDFDKRNGYRLYDLYKYNHFVKRDTVYLTIMVK